MSEFSNRFFNPENDFFGFLGDLVDVVGLSILWLFCCLPVVTIGPACTALYHTVLRGLRQRQPGRYLRFLRCFRDNLKQGAAVTLLCLPAGLLFYFGLPALTALALAGDRMAELLFWCWQTLAVLLGALPLTGPVSVCHPGSDTHHGAALPAALPVGIGAVPGGKCRGAAQSGLVRLFPDSSGAGGPAGHLPAGADFCAVLNKRRQIQWKTCILLRLLPRSSCC